MMLPIWFVHGAGSTGRSFKWLQAQLPAVPGRQLQPMLFEYGVTDSLASSIAALGSAMAEAPPGIVVGHSLGGLIAAGVAAEPACLGVASLAAPYGGLSIALLLGVLRNDQMMRDLSPISGLLRSIRTGLSQCGKPVLPIVATSGLPFMLGANDGVVAVSSQTAAPDVVYRLLPVNHFELLLSGAAAALIADFVHAIATA